MEQQDVYFVDGVRTPFGKAGAKGAYANTRADDLMANAVLGLLERHSGLDRAAIDDVSIAATTQAGDQGVTLGRRVALLSGLPKSVPGYSIDRMCAGAMTAVTTTGSAIGIGAYDLAIAGGVEHMGRHPMAFDDDLNPKFLAEQIFSRDALNMGCTAEELHDRFPHLTKERADAYSVASQHKAAAAY